jgi:hypothetical protein
VFPDPPRSTPTVRIVLLGEGRVEDCEQEYFRRIIIIWDFDICGFAFDISEALLMVVSK